MKLSWYIFPKSAFVSKLLGKYTANSIGSLIFLPMFIYEDLLKEDPLPQNRALLVHEEAHRFRQKKMGLLSFALQYLFNSKFRFDEELYAVQEGMKSLKKIKKNFDFDPQQKMDPKFIYLWPVSKVYSKEELKELWMQV